MNGKIATTGMIMSIVESREKIFKQNLHGLLESLALCASLLREGSEEMQSAEAELAKDLREKILERFHKQTEEIFRLQRQVGEPFR